MQLITSGKSMETSFPTVMAAMTFFTCVVPSESQTAFLHLFFKKKKNEINEHAPKTDRFLALLTIEVVELILQFGDFTLFGGRKEIGIGHGCSVSSSSLAGDVRLGFPRKKTLLTRSQLDGGVITLDLLLA